MPKAGTKKWIAAACAVVVLVSGALAGLWIGLPHMIESVVIPGLGQRLGLETRQAGVRRFGFSGIDIGPVHLGSADQSLLSVETLRIDYSLKTLLHKKITQITASGLRLRCDFDRNGLFIGGIRLPQTPPAAGEPAPLSRLISKVPVGIERIVVEDIVLDLYAAGRHLAIPAGLDIATADLQNGRVGLSLEMTPRRSVVRLDADMDVGKNTVRIVLKQGRLDLERFADLLDDKEMTLKGSVHAEASATCVLQPFSLGTMAFQAEVDNALLTIGGITLKNSFSTVTQKTTPVLFRAESNIADRMDWTMGPLTIASPLTAQIDVFQGKLHSASGVATLTMRGQAALAAQSIPMPDGEPLQLTSDVSLPLTLSATHHPDGATLVNIDMTDPDKNHSLTWRRKGLGGRHRLTRLTVQGKHSRRETTVQYNLALTDNGVSLADAAADCPAFEISGNLRVQNKINGQATVVVRKPKVNAASASVAADQVRLNARLSREKTAPWTIAGDVRVDAGRAADQQNALSLPSFSALLPFQWPPAPDIPQGRLTVESIHWQGHPAGSLHGILQQSNQTIFFDLRHTSKLIPGLIVLLKGKAGQDGGTLTALVPPYQTEKPIDLGKMAPAASGFNLNTRAEANASIVFDRDGLSGRAAIKLEEGRLTHMGKKLNATGLFARIEIDDLAALTGTDQRIQVDKIDFGALKTGALKVAFQLPAPKTLHLKSATMDWCKGSLGIEPVTLFADMKTVDAVIVCEDLNLAMMLQQLGVAEGEGDGIVSGRIPVRWDAGRIRFNQGILSSPPDQTGAIRLRRMGGVEQLLDGLPARTPQRTQLEIALEALKDYTYHHIDLLLNSEKDILLMRLRLEGKPNQLLPFTYDQAAAQFKRSENQRLSDFKGIGIDLNLRSPLDHILNYKEYLKRN